jgi:hypothetical protein
LLLRIDFSLEGKEVAGSLLTWMDGGHLSDLKREIDRFMTASLD